MSNEKEKQKVVSVASAKVVRVKSISVKSSGVTLLKAGSQDFRIPVRLGKDSCGY